MQSDGMPQLVRTTCSGKAAPVYETISRWHIDTCILATSSDLLNHDENTYCNISIKTQSISIKTQIILFQEIGSHMSAATSGRFFFT